MHLGSQIQIRHAFINGKLLSPTAIFFIFMTFIPVFYSFKWHLFTDGAPGFTWTVHYYWRARCFQSRSQKLQGRKIIDSHRQLIYDVWNVQINSWQPPLSFVFFQSVLASWRFYLNSCSILFEFIRYFFRDRFHLFQQGLRFLTPSTRGSNSNFLIFRTSPLTITWYKRIISGKRRIHLLSSWKRKLHSGTNF